MKICNNCSALNVAFAVRCVQCHMPNNFTLEEESTITLEQGDKQPIVCGNCGSNEPGDGDKCVHCRFPLPAQPGSGHFKMDKQVRGRVNTRRP